MLVVGKRKKEVAVEDSCAGGSKRQCPMGWLGKEVGKTNFFRWGHAEKNPIRLVGESRPQTEIEPQKESRGGPKTGNHSPNSWSTKENWGKKNPVPRLIIPVAFCD